MLEALCAILALILVALLMPGFIRFVKNRNMIQPEYELGPDSFRKQEKPPNMGGLVIALSVVLSALLFAQFSQGTAHALLLFLIAVGMMGVGLADDYIKNIRQNHEGLRPRYKIIGQVGIGILFAVLCKNTVGTSIHLPFSTGFLDLGLFYLPLMVLLIVFMTNSANLQDGVDGLMSGVSSVGGLAFGLIATLIDGDSLGNPMVAYTCFALAGACVGFLFHNQPPAKIYMGDTGSMFIGGLFVGAAMLLRLQLWLIPICFTMIMSSVSVIAQRLYFKATKGKRLIRMSPIHHHFELMGWKAVQIDRRYIMVTLILSVVAVLAALPFRP
ncbi:MAG: phospho-N-acetylmuramoyl-pentapeptide-transferase [Eubacteriales bacterium]|nr:phospho-N-acetylmuramoyl-pentapeptide-transferase [Eubacteriales bacterium]MDD4133865.1 phospho-N-acetylmuramoyl-pentapeptide-transferase [Eubacteriales bacterium]